MTEVIKHPRALAIAQKAESALWDMGDYLIEVAGKWRGQNGERDGSMTKIEEVSAELAANGYPDYSVNFMLQLRQTATTFATSDRVRGVSWTAHYEAGTPKMLQAVIDAAEAQGRKIGGRKAGEGISKRFVLQVISGLDADWKAKRKGAEARARRLADKAEEARDKAAREKKEAKDEAARAAAEKREETATRVAERNKERARKLKSAPKPDRSKRKVPTAADVPLVVAKAKFSADTTGLLAQIKRMDKEIAPHIDDLSKAFLVGSIEELLEIAELCRKLVDKLNRNQTNKRSHLHAVA
jgi:hypothetical protein